MSVRLSSKLTTSLLPLHSFFGLLDLKLGSQILTFLNCAHKVAGVYGLLAVFFGGTLAQVLLYVYSIVSIAASAWGLKQLEQENPNQVLVYAHLYLIDHVVATLSTLYFGVQWYVYNPHDGKRIANSAAQKDILEGSTGAGGPGSSVLGDDSAERTRKALAVWHDERGFSTFVLAAGWLLKIYFILILYSFALHLRRGTFRTLLASQQANKNGHSRRPSQANGYAYSHLHNSSAAATGTEGRDSGEVLYTTDAASDGRTSPTELRRGSAPDGAWSMRTPARNDFARRGSERS